MLVRARAIYLGAKTEHVIMKTSFGMASTLPRWSITATGIYDAVVFLVLFICHAG